MDETPLAAAHRAMTTAPDDAAARLAYYRTLAASELCLALAREPAGDQLDPLVIDAADGPLLLAFEDEDRLAAFSGQPQPYAALPGRVILSLMAGQSLSLGVNFETEAGAFLMPAETVDWLAARLAESPAPGRAAPRGWAAPDVPASAAAGLAAALAGAAGLTRRAWLVAALGDGGSRTLTLAFESARPEAEPALAKAGAEALAFSGLAEGRADVLFLTETEVGRAGIDRIALAIPLPPVDHRPPPAATRPAPAAPGSDPARPPRLR